MTPHHMNDMSQWLRLYTDILQNRKVQRLPPELFKGWINLLALTKENDGLLPSIEDVAFRLRMSDEEAESLIEALVERGLLESDGERLTPHNWDGRQYMDTTAAERAKRYRANRDASRDRHDSVTAESQQRHDEITPSDTETEAESETETEQTQSRAESETSRAKPRSVRAPALPDEQWLIELQSDPAYAGLDVPLLYRKMLKWCEVNHKQPSRRRFINWLNREEKPMTAKPTPPKNPAAYVGKSPPAPPPTVIADPVEADSYMAEYVDDLIERNDFIQLGN